MRDLNDTLIFVEVVERGSFTGAARSLRLPKTTVSRKVQDLEARLGAQLLHRTTRKLGLTETGGVYFERCRRVARELDEAERAVAQLQGAPRGWLRFTAPYAIGVTWIAPLLGDFYALYPEVRVEMVLSNENLDLIDEGIDLALRVGSLPDSNLAARRLAVFRSHVYASPVYLARHGEPRHPDDLRRHRSLAMNIDRHNGADYFWTLSDGVHSGDFAIDPVLVANGPAPLKSALLCGEGLMLASDVTIEADAERGCARRVLPGWTGPPLDFNAVFARGRMESPKVRAFIDFLVERLDFDAGHPQLLGPGDRAAQQPAPAIAVLKHTHAARRKLEEKTLNCDGSPAVLSCACMG